MARKHAVGIHIPLYAQTIYVYFSLEQYAGTDFPPGSEAVCWGRTAETSCTIVFKTINPEIIAHEALHAICDLHKHVGIPVNFENQESLAYPLGFLVGRIHEEWKKWEEKQNAK